MNLAKGVLFTVAGLVGFEIFKKISGAKNIRVTSVNINSISLEGSVPVVNLSVGIENTGNQGYQVNSISGSLYAMQEGSEILVGNVSSFNPQVISSNSRQYVSINVSLKVLSIVQNIIRSFQFGNFSISMRFTGSVNVDRFVIPFDESFNIP